MTNRIRTAGLTRCGDAHRGREHDRPGPRGSPLVIPTARYASGGYHAFNNGYAYHVRPDALEILAPNGSTVSYEPWTYYDSTVD